MAQILHELRLRHSKTPHVFPEATHDVTVRNTCGFSTFTLAKVGGYLRRRAFGILREVGLEP